MYELVNLVQKVENILDEHESLVKPICIKGYDAPQALEILEQNVFYDPSMYSLFGTDCCGGLAYFGLNKDIEDIARQADKYLEYFEFDPEDYESKFYFLWTIGDYSLLILYEDYQDELENPYPSNSNVFFTKFGAWISDYELPRILYLSSENHKAHGNHPLVGQDSFDDTNPSHNLLVNQFRDTMKIIWPTFDFEEAENDE